MESHIRSIVRKFIIQSKLSPRKKALKWIPRSGSSVCGSFNVLKLSLSLTYV